MRVLTFDIEDWFHLLDNEGTRTASDWASYEPRLERNVDRILECLSRHEQKATFFCLGWIARRHPDVIRAICAGGHHVGSHSDMHQLAYAQSPAEYEEDLKRSIATLEDLIGRKVRHYRAPGFSITWANVWAFEKLVEAGIEADFSIFPSLRAHGGLRGLSVAGPMILDTPSGALRVFPINVWHLLGQPLVFSGGGYFRVLPAPLLHAMFMRSDYVMT
jgi:polysaccharide deacetylase family protein (PEP-CTERM system associated)